MASLYDAIRKPWAAWEMTMEGHDPANFRCLDFSGNGRHLRLGDGAGASEPTKLVQGRGYRNTGTNYMMASGVPWTSSRGTVEILALPYTNDTSGALIDVRHASGSPTQFMLLSSAGGYRFYSGSDAAVNAAYPLPTRPQTGVVHLVGRYNGTTTELFRDGASVVSAATPIPPEIGTTDINLFRRYNTISNYTGCDIYLCRIWDVALTDIQIQELSRRAKRELHRI